MAPDKISRQSLSELAAKLAMDGPVKHEPANRRVRGLLKGNWLFDTMNAEYVWEHPYYPVFFIPLDDLVAGPAEVSRDKPDDRGFWNGALSLGNEIIRVVGFDTGPLKDLVKIPVQSIDAWYAEDEVLLGPHPKDPYKRIECLASSREIRIEVEGTVVARSMNNVFLHETSLKTRYYLSPTSILDWKMLVPKEKKSK